MGTFLTDCPRIRKQNQESCYEPIEQFEFVDSSISQLLVRVLLVSGTLMGVSLGLSAL